MNTKRLILISVFLVFIMQACGLEAAQSLQFSISFDKKEYAQTDPINITFTLKNKGRKEVYVNKRFFLGKEVRLFVKGPSGEDLAYKLSSETGLPKSDYFVLLKKHEEAVSDRKQNIRHCFDFNQPGEYAIYASYENIFGAEIGLDAFKDKVKSNAAKIKITE